MAKKVLIKEYYQNNPVVGFLPNTGKLVGVGGDCIKQSRPPHEDKIFKEATQKEYRELMNAGLYPAALYWDEEEKANIVTKRIKWRDQITN